MRARTLGLLAVVVTVLPVGLTVVARGADPAAPQLSPPLAEHRSLGSHAVAILRRWDERRAHAWAAGDPAALARLYVPRSATGARDIHDLRRWADRGLRVTGLRQQIAELRVTGRRPGRLDVVVVDRTVDGVAVGGGRRTAVPASAWVTHRISLRLTATGWRVVDARTQPAQPAR